MPTKWTEKDVLEHARELKSPFDVNQRKQPSPDLVLKAIRGRGNGNKGLPLPKVVKET